MISGGTKKDVGTLHTVCKRLHAGPKPTACMRPASQTGRLVEPG